MTKKINWCFRHITIHTVQLCGAILNDHKKQCSCTVIWMGMIRRKCSWVASIIIYSVIRMNSFEKGSGIHSHTHTCDTSVYVYRIDKLELGVQVWSRWTSKTKTSWYEKKFNVVLLFQIEVQSPYSSKWNNNFTKNSNTKSSNSSYFWISILFEIFFLIII